MGKINPIGFRALLKNRDSHNNIHPLPITVPQGPINYNGKLTRNYKDFQNFFLFIEEYFTKTGFIISDYTIISLFGNKRIATFYLFKRKNFGRKPVTINNEIPVEIKKGVTFLEKLFFDTLRVQIKVIIINPKNIDFVGKTLSPWSRTPYFDDGLSIFSLVGKGSPLKSSFPPGPKGQEGGATLIAKFISLELGPSGNNHQRFLEFIGQGLTQELFTKNLNFSKGTEGTTLRGFSIQLKGRVSGAERALKTVLRKGPLPLHTIKANIDYSYQEAITPYGTLGVKVYLYYK